MTTLTRFQYVTGEDERTFPHIPIGLDEAGEPNEFTGATLNVGDIIEAVVNPDDTRFVEYSDPPPPLTAKQQKALDAQVAQQLAEQNAALAQSAGDQAASTTAPQDATPAPTA